MREMQQLLLRRGCGKWWVARLPHAEQAERSGRQQQLHLQRDGHWRLFRVGQGWQVAERHQHAHARQQGPP